MINVNGQTYEEAKARLEQLGFSVQSVSKLNNGGNTSGTVASADLTPGQQYAKGTTVTLQVWSEVQTTANDAREYDDFYSGVGELFNNYFGTLDD